MHTRRFALIATTLLLIGSALPSHAAPQSWEFRDGRWQQVASPSTQPVTPEPILDQVEQMLVQRQAKAAHKIVLNWVNEHKDSPQRDRGLYLLAEAYFQNGDRIWSFYQLDELMDTYPDSRYFYAALQKQYDIADAFLKGYKRRFFWMPIIGMEEEAIEMLYRIQQRSPGSPLAETALRRTADYYFADAQYDLASDAYASYAKSYPRSPYIQTIRLRQAFSYYAQFRGVRFDPTSLTDARAQLLDLIKEYPDLAKSENLPAFIERIDETFARKAYYTADFYRRTHEPRGAAWFYHYVIKTFPNSPEADKARQDLQTLPPSALEPEPLIPPATAPSTQPETK